MSYRVLARAYRSNTFDEIVGQDAIATTLKNAITSGRIHHGYLFTGTRGVGKTSMARILAKSLNCLESDGPTVSPCCKCDSCAMVAAGEDVDVVEIDAASNTGVDNIRDLRSNASFRPARSRFKVYIIDEVHMLSTGAFNALLKTLEEPPPHIKFVLATTELHKVPATIQSRCQRFDFRAIDVPSIASHLQRVLDAEGIQADPAVVRRVARLASGSMRDGLSLLDKLLSYESQNLTIEVVNQVLPPPHDELAAAVLDRVAERDAAGALAALDEALQTGRTVGRFCEHLIEHVRTLMLLRLCGKETELVDVTESMRGQLADAAGKFDAPTYIFMISLLEELQRSARYSGASRALADAAVARMAMSHQFTDLSTLVETLVAGGEPPATAGAATSKKKVLTASEAPAPAEPPPSPQPTRTAAPAPAPAAASAKPPSQAPPAATKISSEQWQRVACDPFVQKVTEVFDGRLHRVLPGPESLIADEVREADTADEPDDTLSNTESD